MMGLFDFSDDKKSKGNRHFGKWLVLLEKMRIFV